MRGAWRLLCRRAHQTNAAFHRGARPSGKELGYYSSIQIELLYAPRYVRSPSRSGAGITAGRHIASERTLRAFIAMSANDSELTSGKPQSVMSRDVPEVLRNQIAWRQITDIA